MINEKGQFMKEHNKGIKHSVEHIIKMKKNHKGFSGHTHTAKTKEIIGQYSVGRIPWNKGIPMLEETKKKIGYSLKGRVITLDARKKISDKLKNRVLSDEHKNNLSISLKCRVPWNKGIKRPPFSDDWKKKISNGVRGKFAGEKHYNYGKHLSDETCNKISIALIGKTISEKQKQIISEMNKKRVRENNPNWKGGITSFYERLRTSLVYRTWRKEILKRDIVCVVCGTNKQLEVDHKKQFAHLILENNITTLEQARMCKNLWTLDNGQVLCNTCHKQTNTYSNRSFR